MIRSLDLADDVSCVTYLNLKKHGEFHLGNKVRTNEEFALLAKYYPAVKPFDNGKIVEIRQYRSSAMPFIAVVDTGSASREISLHYISRL